MNAETMENVFDEIIALVKACGYSDRDFISSIRFSTLEKYKGQLEVTCLGTVTVGQSVREALEKQREWLRKDARERFEALKAVVR